MNDLACLHGAGYRLVIRQKLPEAEPSIQADLFGPDGIANALDAPITLDVVEFALGSALVIGERAASQIAQLIADADVSQVDEGALMEIARSAPVRNLYKTGRECGSGR